MKNIVIPVDFSKASDSALAVATEIARKTHAEVTLLHFIEAPYEAEFTATGDVSLPEGMDKVFVLKSIEAARKNMHKIMNDAAHAGVRFHSKIITGSPYKHFTSEVVKEPADLIIMGTEGSDSFLKGIFNSSNAEKVVTRAHCMVLTVKSNIRDFKIRNVIFATDFKDDAPEFLENIKNLQNIFDFRLHIIYIDALLNGKSDHNKIQERKEAFLKASRFSNYEFHISEDMTEYNGIADYAGKINADIIALSTHQKKGLHFLGGVSEDLVNYSDKPILTYKVRS